ncbi:translation initiation factor IF-2 [Candidatus Peregrinibacteria bacterium]|nr:translation initiation factor IF-2 [Candidatus Peregrinibacteria bacterium]
MHLNEIARELRITTQELRRELAKTNFGISPTAHEIDDALATGVTRFLKGKIKPTLKARKVAVIGKDGSVKEEVKKDEEGNADEEGERKEIIIEKKQEKKKPPVKKAMTKKEKEEIERKEKEAELEKLRKEGKLVEQDRSHVPKNEDRRPSEGAALPVSRRIEVEEGEKGGVDNQDLPKHYYKSKKRKKKKGKQAEEDLVLETMQRHPGRKVRIAKVSYEEENADGMSAEEIAVAKEMDREAFRAQKKGRAISQKRGPKEQPQIKAKTGTIEIPTIISVKEFSEKCGIPVPSVIACLFRNGIMATINQKLDFETAEIIADELGVKVKKKEEEARAEDLLEGDMAILLKDSKSKLKTRPPIVSIMGHVDHGKTKILDYIRKANVVATEAGGITQHIGAYQVEKDGNKITFLDTPGHEAFTSMRARGAKATDIAILVVAADEGVKPQTIEAINHAKEAGIPIIVAINKIDKPNANPDKVKGELVEYGLQSEDWGGKTIMVPCSAITGEGMDKLLEMILLVAEMEDLKANPNRLAVGTVVESHLDKSLGPVATILVNTGTLEVGDNIVVGTALGRVKAMHDHRGRILTKVPPSGAVRISGLSEVPQAGDIVQAFKTEKTAKDRAAELTKVMAERKESMGGSMVERIVSQISSGEMKFLKIVLKADTKGSLEAIMQALQKIKSDDVAVKVIHFGVGNITDTDVIMASASQALLFGFHISPTAHVKKIGEREGIEVKNYTIIYKLIEDVKAIISGMMAPEIKVVELGNIEIKEIFLNKKSWVIAGGKVTKGTVESKSMARVTRKGELLFETELESLKHVKEDVSELEKGSDCGVKIKTPVPVEPGDVLEVFKIEKIERSLD